MQTVSEPYSPNSSSSSSSNNNRRRQENTRYTTMNSNNTTMNNKSALPTQQKRRRQQFNWAEIFQKMYWYLVFPGLILTALLSLRDLTSLGEGDYAYQVSSSSSSSSSVPQKTLMKFPGMESSGNGNFQFKRASTTTTTTTALAQKGLGGDESRNADDDGPMREPKQVTSPQQTHWWKIMGQQQQQQQQQMMSQRIGGPSHPKFLQTLELAREFIQNQTQVVLVPPLATWKPAPTPKQPYPHDTTFIPHILPPPNIVNTTTTVILVVSAQNNFLRRQAIRETWGKNHQAKSVYFVVGQSNCDEFETEPDEEDRQIATEKEVPMLEDQHDELGARRRRRLQQFPQNDKHNNNNTTHSTKGANLRGTASAKGSPSTRSEPSQGQDTKVKVKVKVKGASIPACVQADHNFLLQEQMQYQDLLEIPMKDHYRRLPEKVVQAYRWVDEHIPSVRWLVKADDDTYVSIDSLEHYLDKYNWHMPMVLGKIIPRSHVSREGKWAEREYESDYYPYWPQGSAGHVVSRATAKYIVESSPNLQRYQGEDVSIGIWLDEAQKSKQLKKVIYIQAKRMITNDGTQWCGNVKYIMIGHDLSPEEMYDCYLQFGNQTLKENAWLDDPAEFEEEYNNDWGAPALENPLLTNPGRGGPANRVGASLFTSKGTTSGASSLSGTTPVGKAVGYRGPLSLIKPNL